MMEKVKLAGGPEKIVTWIWLEGGQLKVEYYDFSELTQEMFGNDIAYTLTVNNMTKLCSLAKHDSSSLIQWMTKNFDNYFALKQWLEENGIDFTKEIDPWA
jgi:hypothetical protein